MNDALIGVVLGGLVACVAPLLTLRYTERRWRFEANISYLKTERDRFEKLYEVNLKRFTSGVIENSYSPELTAEIITIMPDEIRDLYVEWLNENEKTDSKRKFVCLNMAVKMKKDLAKKDLEIRALFEK
jgi:gas vesicle protein